MNDESIFRLKKKFRATFPGQSQLLELAKSQDEIDELHTRFISDAKENMITSMKKSGVSDDHIKRVVGGDFTDIPAILATNEEYEDLINATGKEIENKIHVLMDGLQRLRSLKGTHDYGLFAASMVLAGIVAFNVLLWAEPSALISEGSYVATAALFGVTAVEDVFAFYLIENAIILLLFAVLLPILHFMDKPANCIVVVINETDESLYLIQDYSIHGHLKGATNEFPPGTKDPNGKLFPSMGFIATVKNKNSLYGSQLGFVLRYGKADSPIKFGFGVECPLTRIHKVNNCFCQVSDVNVENAAKLTDKHNKQEWSDSNSSFTVSIKCNSKSGSTAYYIARVLQNTIVEQ